MAFGVGEGAGLFSGNSLNLKENSALVVSQLRKRRPKIWNTERDL